MLPSFRILKPELPLARTLSSNWGRALEVALTLSKPPALEPVVANVVERPLTPSSSDTLVRLVMASRCRESGVLAVTIRETLPCSRVLVTEPSEPVLVRGR